ncbi:MAG: hypothetical protein ACK50E_05855 [Bacteroidota bacterium]
MDFNDSSDLFEKHQREYHRIKSLARQIISDFFHQHRGFDKISDAEVFELKEKYKNYEYRFRYVVRKYFMNVTFDLRQIPWKYVLPIFKYYFIKKYSRRYKYVIENYSKDFMKRILKLQSDFPDLIEREQDLSQVLKLITASCITCYINLPFFKKKAHKEKLHRAFLAGYYYGVAYLVSDKSLDSPYVSFQDKKEFHFSLLRILACPSRYQSDNKLLNSLQDLINKELPSEEFSKQYELLFFLQSVQFEDSTFCFELYNDEELIDKITLLALKTHLSLFTIQSFNTDLSLEDSILKHLKYSLLVQLDDDLRDVEKDRDEKIRTFFTTEWKETTFSPHSLYLALVKDICLQNPKLHWLYADYFLHLKKESGSPSLDHEKIQMFLKKTTGIELKDIYNTVVNNVSHA